MLAYPDYYRPPEECQICQRDIRAYDIAAENVHNGESGFVHLACTRDGVKRWHRENRPCADPLAADRHLEWTWHVEEVDRSLRWDREVDHRVNGAPDMKP